MATEVISAADGDKVWRNEKKLVKATWNFAVDGGAVGSLALLTADKECIVKLAWLKVLTTVTSAANGLKMSFGLAGGGEFITDALEATLVSGYMISSGGAIHLGVNDQATMAITVEDATAGKIEFWFEVFSV